MPSYNKYGLMHHIMHHTTPSMSNKLPSINKHDNNDTMIITAGHKVYKAIEQAIQTQIATNNMKPTNKY